METRVRAKIWLQVGDDVPFGPRKAALLSAIREYGSIRKAAKDLRMSYRCAWVYLRDLETELKFSVVETQVGGSRGGGARLTPRGAELLDLYEAVHRRVSRAMAPHDGTVV